MRPCLALHRGEGSFEVVEGAFAFPVHTQPSKFGKVHRSLRRLARWCGAQGHLALLEGLQHADVVLSKRVDTQHRGALFTQMSLAAE